MLFWMLALCLSASVSLQSHKIWSTVSLTLQKGHSLLSCLFMMYPCVAMVQPVRNLELTTWSRLFIFFVSLFHSISFFLFFILFLLFCHLAFFVFLSSVLIQLIRSCGGYFFFLTYCDVYRFDDCFLFSTGIP
jgi:hypothetical protein